MYQKKNYPERPCVICGTMFRPFRLNVKTCSNPECKYKLKLEQQKEWYRSNYTQALECRRNYRQRIRAEVDKPHEPKPDTIVAIGYAERQIAESLKMAGKVNTKL